MAASETRLRGVASVCSVTDIPELCGDHNHFDPDDALPSRPEISFTVGPEHQKLVPLSPPERGQLRSWKERENDISRKAVYTCPKGLKKERDEAIEQYNHPRTQPDRFSYACDGAIKDLEKFRHENMELSSRCDRLKSMWTEASMLFASERSSLGAASASLASEKKALLNTSLRWWTPDLQDFKQFHRFQERKASYRRRAGIPWHIRPVSVKKPASETSSSEVRLTQKRRRSDVTNSQIIPSSGKRRKAVPASRLWADELGDLIKENETLVIQRDSLSKNAQKLATNCARLTSQKDVLIGKCERLASEKADLATKCASLAMEKDWHIAHQKRNERKLQAEYEQKRGLDERTKADLERRYQVRNEELSKEIRRLKQEEQRLQASRKQLDEERRKATPAKTTGSGTTPSMKGQDIEHLAWEKDQLLTSNAALTFARDQLQRDLDQLRSGQSDSLLSRDQRIRDLETALQAKEAAYQNASVNWGLWAQEAQQKDSLILEKDARCRSLESSVREGTIENAALKLQLRLKDAEIKHLQGLLRAGPPVGVFRVGQGVSPRKRADSFSGATAVGSSPPPSIYSVESDDDDEDDNDS